MNKILTKVATLALGAAMVAGVGVAVGSKAVSEAMAAEGDTVATFSSAAVVGGTATGYTSYSDSDWDLNIGGNKVSAGWNKNASNARQVGETYAIDSQVTATTYGWVAVTKSALANVGKLELSYTSGSGNGNGKLWLASSSNGTTFNKVTLTVGTQGMSCGSTGTTYTFEFDTVDSAYYAIIVTGGSSGSAFRFDSVTANFIEGSTGTPKVLENLSLTGSMTKTAYYVGEAWNPSGFSVVANYDDDSHPDVTSSVTWSYSPASPALNVTSVVATATFGGKSISSSAQTVSVSRTNPIQAIYTKTSGSVDVYGYYVGFLDGTGPVIMDGDYGIVIYNKTADVSSYTVNETILHATGSISIYKGLYEIGSATISVASGTYDAPDAPVVYATAGGETAEYASRLTTVTGTATVTSGSFDSDAGTADIKMNFTVGSKTVQVFYKKAAQTADADAFAAMKQAVTDGTEITIKGFTGWYNGFQVQMNGYIPAAVDYTAEIFAQDLLDQTDAVCTGYEEGDNNHDALVAIWSNLASNDKYPSLPSAEKTKLAEAERDESGTVVEQAMARYDFLTGKYSLSNFINGRTPIVPAGSYVPSYENNLSSSSSITIIVIVAVASMTLLGVTLVIRKRKMN